MRDAMTAALNAVAHTGWVDTTRLGVSGHSYGGYMVNFLVTQMTQFKAAVSFSGVSDLISGYLGDGNNLQFYEVGQGRLGLPVWEAPERYIKNSPVSYLDRVGTPLLIIHGVKDPTVPVGQSQEMFRGLARLGKPAELVLYHNAEHLGPPFNAAWWGRALDWFDKYLCVGNLQINRDLRVRDGAEHHMSTLALSRSGTNSPLTCASSTDSIRATSPPH
jgi:dipeptidyl aminopeptidase/acylaminoacyl peptidase